MHNNLKKRGYNGDAYKRAMWSAACSTTEKEYKIRMEEIKGLHVGAWEWFQDKPPTQWSKAFFNVNTKCDMLLNNVCESFNFAILPSRDKAIITMLEWIREYLVKRLQKHRDRAASKCFDGKQFTVDLKEKECTCRAWQLCGIPCTHAACAILAQNLDPIDFVHSYYSVDAYVKAYENPIMGISYEVLWDKTFFIPPMPPNFGKPKRGRKATTRRKEEDEGAAKGKNKRKMRRQGGKIKCRICGIEGHNAATCGKKKQKESTQGLVDEEMEDEQLDMNVGEGSSRKPMVAPPRFTKESTNKDPEICSAPNPPQLRSPPTLTQGPTMFQQLQMAHDLSSSFSCSSKHPHQSVDATIQRRVQIRCPPPFTGSRQSQLTNVIQEDENLGRDFMVGAQKFMDLSSQSSSAAVRKGKKKI